MAYGKRRSTYRRSGRRGARTLSTRRIFNNKSARSQAKQIHALRRRINRVYRATKPEVKILEQGEYNAVQLLPGPTGLTAFQETFLRPVLGTGDNERTGNVINLKAATIFLSAKYSATTHSSSTIPMYNLTNGAIGAGLRVIAVQTKVARSTAPSLQSILHNAISDSASGIYSMANLKIPFEDGITTSYHVLMDRVYQFTNNRPIISKRINIRPVMKTYRWDPPMGSADIEYPIPAGAIFVFFIQGGLESSGSDLTTADYTAISMSYTMKLAYTDP